MSKGFPWGSVPRDLHECPDAGGARCGGPCHPGTADAFGGGLAGLRLSFPAGFPEALGWVSELLARLGLIQTRLWQPADRVLARK